MIAASTLHWLGPRRRFLGPPWNPQFFLQANPPKVAINSQKPHNYCKRAPWAIKCNNVLLWRGCYGKWNKGRPLPATHRLQQPAMAMPIVIQVLIISATIMDGSVDATSQMQRQKNHSGCRRAYYNYVSIALTARRLLQIP